MVKIDNEDDDGLFVPKRFDIWKKHMVL